MPRARTLDLCRPILAWSQGSYRLEEINHPLEVWDVNRRLNTSCWDRDDFDFDFCPPGPDVTAENKELFEYWDRIERLLHTICCLRRDRMPLALLEIHRQTICEVQCVSEEAEAILIEAVVALAERVGSFRIDETRHRVVGFAERSARRMREQGRECPVALAL